MFLYNLTLQPPTAISTAVVGHFSGEKQQEIIVARQQRLEVWRANTSTGKLTIAHSEDMFCRIRGLAQFRISGGSKDYVVVGADTGALLVLEYNSREGRFERVQYHEFGRTGLRRVVAGQYVAADPRGRAVMVAAIERSKIVYIITRDSEGRVLLASPLEASRSNTVCFDVVGVDVGYENPVFAALEAAYADETEGAGAGEGEDKQLVYYELDLGLNHVVRKWSAAVGGTAHRLIAVPGGSDGPSGVLVCLAGAVEFRHSSSGTDAVGAALPRRAGEAAGARGAMVVASAVHRMRGAFFILVQTEAGDLFKIRVDYGDDGAVRGVAAAYFDTVAAASSLGILRAGFLFAAAAADGGSHALYQIESLGGEDENEDEKGTTFEPRAADALQCVALADEIDSISPVIRAQVLNVAGEATAQIYALAGRGARAALKIIRHGADVAEVAASELPGTARAVWAVAADQLIAVSFADATLVLRVADDAVAEAPGGAGLDTAAPTLWLHALPDGGGLLQVTPRAVRVVARGGAVAEWVPAGGRAITCGAGAGAACVVAVRGALVWLHAARGAVREAARADVGDVTCVALAGARACVAGCGDATVRLLRLGSEETEHVGVQIEHVGVLALGGAPHAIATVRQGGAWAAYVGLRSGVLVRARVDVAGGEVGGDVRTRVVGAGPVQVCAVADGAVLAMTPQAPWLCYAQGARVRAAPLAYDALDFAAPFSDGALVCVAAGELRILALDPHAIAPVSHASIALAHTPRAFALHPASRHFAVVEAPRRPAASLLRVLNPFDGATTCLLDIGAFAVSLAAVAFGSPAAAAFDPSAAAAPDASDSTENDLFLAVGCADPPAVRLYRWADAGTALELVHVTPIEGADEGAAPHALAAFGALLAVGVGRAVCLYGLGRRRLLRKARGVVAPRAIAALQPAGPDRLLVADVRESLLLVAVAPAGSASASSAPFRVLVEDSLPRHITCMHQLDSDTVAAGDKFGNLFVVRAPPTAAVSGVGRWESVAEFHVGDIVTSLTTCELTPGSRPVLLYTTLLGGVQIAIPLPSASDRDFFRDLEAHIRKSRLLPLSGRDHLSYRSALIPVRSFVDGDLCELFFSLPDHVRESISDQMDRTQQDIFKKIDDIRSTFAF
ncbi:pre-mRNA-splicing factor rse1 [Coemansia thaxteri]|nr:pre-mRNA-splicing factor rse1 [Coemansia thaxteri]